MVTNRFYVGLFGACFFVAVAMGALVSGGDPGFVAFLSGIAVVTIGLVAALSIPFIRAMNGWQAAPLTALAPRVGGVVVATIGGDTHVRLPDGTVVFWTRTVETPGGAEDTPGTPWTCVGRLRSGRGAPAVEVRLLPDGTRAVRWTNRWWDILPRRPARDPLGTPSAHEAALALAALAPGVESRLTYAGELVAFLVPGHRTDPAALAALTDAARPHLARLD